MKITVNETKKADKYKVSYYRTINADSFCCDDMGDFFSQGEPIDILSVKSFAVDFPKSKDDRPCLAIRYNSDDECAIGLDFCPFCGQRIEFVIGRKFREVVHEEQVTETKIVKRTYIEEIVE